jgi:exodeoxyribonuclease X
VIVVTLDTETSGTDPEDQAIEVGLIVRNLSYSASPVMWSSLVKPTVPVNAAARGNHHILDEELASAPAMGQITGILRECFAQADIIAGHNLAFDLRMLAQSGVPEDILPPAKVCTWICARHLWPDAPNYANQTLRYWRELNLKTGPSHRALDDALVTDALMQNMLKEVTPQRLIELTALPVLQTKVAFGKHRGKLWSEIDINYCRWLLDPRRQPPFNDEVRFAAQHWLKIQEEKYAEKKRLAVQEKSK